MPYVPFFHLYEQIQHIFLAYFCSQFGFWCTTNFILNLYVKWMGNNIVLFGSNILNPSFLNVWKLKKSCWRSFVGLEFRSYKWPRMFNTLIGLPSGFDFCLYLLCLLIVQTSLLGSNQLQSFFWYLKKKCHPTVAYRQVLLLELIPQKCHKPFKLITIKSI